MRELISAVLPGVAEMPNIHPMLVHFPIALLNGFLLMEVLGFIFRKDDFRVAARWMLYLGTLGALVAVLAGLRAEATLSHTDAIHELLLRHKSFGITVLVLSVILSLWRIVREKRFKGGERVAHIILGAVMLAVMVHGADMGGLMVYKYGAGVKAVPVSEGHDHGTHGHGDDESAKDAVKAASEAVVDAKKPVTEKPLAVDGHHDNGAGHNNDDGHHDGDDAGETGHNNDDGHHDGETEDERAKEEVKDHHDDVPHAH